MILTDADDNEADVDNVGVEEFCIVLYPVLMVLLFVSIVDNKSLFILDRWYRRWIKINLLNNVSIDVIIIIGIRNDSVDIIADRFNFSVLVVIEIAFYLLLLPLLLSLLLPLLLSLILSSSLSPLTVINSSSPSLLLWKE